MGIRSSHLEQKGRRETTVRVREREGIVEELGNEAVYTVLNYGMCKTGLLPDIYHHHWATMDNAKPSLTINSTLSCSPSAPFLTFFPSAQMKGWNRKRMASLPYPPQMTWQ